MASFYSYLRANDSSCGISYNTQFVLICHPGARYWQDRFQHFPCKIVTIGEQGEYLDKNHDFLEKYEISKQGAVLVRPDGHVAWHSSDVHEKMPHFSWRIDTQ